MKVKQATTRFFFEEQTLQEQVISDLVSWISISEGLRILNKSGHYQTKSVIKVRNLNVISEVWVTQMFHNSIKEIRVIQVQIRYNHFYEKKSLFVINSNSLENSLSPK